MRASVVIAAHNEGSCLWRTVGSCKETAGALRFEIIVSDDASNDGSVQETRARFADVRVVSSEFRCGCSPAKDRGAREAQGEVLVFLDGHCKPAPRAIERLVNAVQDLDGQAIVAPRVPHLDANAWENSRKQVGAGYTMDLETFDGSWIPASSLRKAGSFYESPALVGCCLACSRQLYERLRGFDRDMLEWGVENIDFSLKAWLLGHPILCHPYASIGHCFAANFDSFAVSSEAVAVNELRMARKNFTDEVWKEWLEKFKSRLGADEFQSIWNSFNCRRDTAEEERAYLLANRVRDEYWYASHFGLKWPKKRDSSLGES